MENTNEKFMQMAIELSAKNLDGKNGGPFGAVIAKDGKLVSKSENLVKANFDVSAHAEVMAIRLAGKNLQTVDLTGCVLYTSCEPCPMCMAAIFWANISKVYYANSGTDAADIGFSDELIKQQLELPKSNRTIPMVELSRDEANIIFKSWYENRN